MSLGQILTQRALPSGVGAPFLWLRFWGMAENRIGQAPHFEQPRMAEIESWDVIDTMFSKARCRAVRFKDGHSKVIQDRRREWACLKIGDPETWSVCFWFPLKLPSERGAL